MQDERLRARQGRAQVRGGVPYSDPETTLSLLPGAAVGEWLARQRDHIGGRLLDAGCGNQPFADWYGPLVTEAVCLDALPLPGVHVVGFADRLPFAESSFDTVLATEVLEHVEDAERAVADIRRVLVPGGHVVITVPYLYPTHEAPYDFRRFTHYGLESLLRRHGLEVVTVDAKGGPVLLGWHFLVLALVAGLNSAWGRMRGRPLTDARVPRLVLSAPQELLIRRGRVRTQIRGTAARVSLGYMAVARRPREDDGP